MPSPSAAHRKLAPLLAALAVGVFLWESRERTVQVDDAYISYRYARNLAEGHGLVYNPGERVEGFTNLAWTLLVAGAVAMGVDAEATGHALGLASGAAALVAAYAYARTLLPPTRAGLAALAPWLVLASPGFVRWSTAGLETPLFAAAVTATLAAEARGRIGAATCFAVLATLTRPEGALLAATLYALHALRRGIRDPRTWRAPLAYALFLALLTGFRLAYFGSPVPNTFYAKVGGVPLVQGAIYLGGFLQDGGLLLLLPAAVVMRALPAARTGSAFAGAMAVYVVAVGGDFFGLHRFLVPLVPALVALALAGADAAFATRRDAGVALWLCIAGAVWQQNVGAQAPAPADLLPRRAAEIERVRSVDEAVARRADRSARVLRERGETSALVAAAAIGRFGYVSGVPLIDILGLVDATIARSDVPASGVSIQGHRRTDADYVLSREPDYLMIKPRRGDQRSIVPAVNALWEHPDLLYLYEWDPEFRGYRRRATPLQRRGREP